MKMRKCKNSIVTMLFAILVSILVIAICNLHILAEFRVLVSQHITFLDGKATVIENIFIGVLGSSLIALVGFLYEYKSEKRVQETNIKQLFKMMYYHYYKQFGKEQIQDIKYKYVNDSFFDKLHEYKNNYLRGMICKRNNYNLAIDIMYNVEVYYFDMVRLENTKDFCLYMIDDCEKSIEWFNRINCDCEPIEIQKRIDELKQNLSDLASREENVRKKALALKDCIDEDVIKLLVAFDLYDCSMDKFYAINPRHQ